MTFEHAIGSGIVIQTVPPFLQNTISSIVAAIPAIVAAIVILIIGLIVGRVLGGVVTRVVSRAHPSRYLQGTAIETGTGTDDRLAGSLGNLVKYIVYLFAILLALQQVNLPIPGAVLSNIVGIVLRVVGAAIILIVGFAIGRFVGDIVASIVSGFGLNGYVRNTPIAAITESVGGIGNAIGKIVEYLIYYFALVQAVDALNFGILTRLFTGVTNYLPALIGAAIILVVGFTIGRLVGDAVANVVGGFGLDGHVRSTPLAGLTESFGGVANVVGKVVEYLIYYFALVQAVDTLDFTILTRLFTGVTNYLPTLIGALVFLVVGIYVADFLGNVVSRVNDTRLTSYAGTAVRVFAYYFVITTVIARLGLNVGILNTLFTTAATAFFGAIGVALAIGLGLGVGWGSKDYVAENIDGWVSGVRDSAADLTEESDDEDGFESPSDD